ncbi:MAG TPA: GNAT family N-acetyltransferase, partial [Lachnospiraceae bacterium]|nr:GNAT family N-acetyltransferase [Lachnospiraceae bacterium]
MKIRRAQEKDVEEINNLLCQVLMIHHNGRPDLFQRDTKKYTDKELRELIRDETRPIFVGVDKADKVLGYVFCVFQQHLKDNILTDI